MSAPAARRWRLSLASTHRTHPKPPLLDRSPSPCANSRASSVRTDREPRPGWGACGGASLRGGSCTGARRAQGAACVGGRGPQRLQTGILEGSMRPGSSSRRAAIAPSGQRLDLKRLDHTSPSGTRPALRKVRVQLARQKQAARQSVTTCLGTEPKRAWRGVCA